MKLASIKKYIAKSTSSKDIQLFLVKDIEPITMCALAMNPNLTEEAQFVLSNFTDWTGDILAQNPNLSKKTQLILARSDCIEILYNLCYNTNICNEAKDILKSRNVIKLNYNITISSFRI